MLFPTPGSDALLLSLLLISSGLGAPANPLQPSLQGRSISINPEYEPSNKAWPLKTVTYCFKTKADEKALHGILTEGWGFWVKGEADSKVKNGLKIAPVDSDGTLCDKNVNALEISTNKNCVRSSTPGYIEKGAAGRHNMKFDPSDKCPNGPTTMAMAHELGHVFGLYHEHQRPDAAETVSFNCENLKDYAEALKKHGEPAMKILCTNGQSARNEDFSASEFIPFVTSKIYVVSPSFDKESIMLYSSTAGAISAKKPVLTWKEGKDKTIPTPKKCSQGDMERIAALYPHGSADKPGEGSDHGDGGEHVGGGGHGNGGDRLD